LCGFCAAERARNIGSIPGSFTGDSPDEIWRPIPTTAGIYEASNLGRVRRAETRHVLVSRSRPRDGYVSVDLSIDGRRVTKTVNTLVCEAFHGARPEGYECAHLNGDRADNREGNLGWATPAENADHRWRHGTMICGEAIPHHKLTEADVTEIREKRRQGAKYRELGELYGVRLQTIEKIVKGMRWKHVASGEVAGRA
jgi:hypothetical protein